MDRLVPARAVNEVLYCKRLAWLMFVAEEWADSADTQEGRFIHRRVAGDDDESPPLPVEVQDGQVEAMVSPRRSVRLVSRELGLTGVVDLLESNAGEVVPVEYKRGKFPEKGPYLPEMAQVAAYSMLLRSNGYGCAGGVIYYSGSRKRIDVPITPELESEVVRAVAEVNKLFEAEDAPPPLEDSPKCHRCSLVGICLPDETWYLKLRRKELPRRMYAVQDDAKPVYIQEQGAKVGKHGESLKVRSRTGEVSTRLLDISQVCLFGSVQITAQALALLLDNAVPVLHYSYGAWFRGITFNPSWHNVMLRVAQYRAVHDAAACLALSRNLVHGKVHNSWVLVRRNLADSSEHKAELDRLSDLRSRVLKAGSLDELLGLEGEAASLYFKLFARLLTENKNMGFDFNGRNRRPPRDPVNAVLSFLYALLLKDISISAWSVGFDPGTGFYHQLRSGRPSLALDFMEEFRPLIADSVALSLFNKKMLERKDFVFGAGSCALRTSGRKKVIKAYEKRMESMVVHPVFGYSLSYRRALEIQARLAAKYITGEIDSYPAFKTR